MMTSLDYRLIPTEELILDEGETSRRLQSAKGFTFIEIEECLEELKKVVCCKFSAARTKVTYFGDDRLDLGFGEFQSATLIKNLKGSPEAFVFAVTLGIGVDRLLMKLSSVSTLRYFITDALASSMAEAAADKAEEMIKEETLTRPRFSPGFGDLSLELQPKILTFLNAQRLLGITTNETLLMSPGKSVTAVMGIKYE